MASKSTINVQITGDASKLNRAVDDAQSRLGKFGGGLKTFGKTAALAFGGIAAGAVVAAPKILEAGVALDAMAKKSETVFEGSLGSVRKWADENASALGLTSDQLVGMAANTADLLKPMGMSAEAAAGMATETNELAGALSAWSGGSKDAAEVSAILTKAYLGEREGLKELGISISEADVQARLLEKGQNNLTGAALQQAKALATQELIMEKSTDAQRAWADGSMDGVKAQNEAKASIENVKESLVKALAPAIGAMLPLVEKFATWLGEHLPGAIDVVKQWFEDNWPKIQATIQAVVTWFNDEALPVIKAVAGFIVDAFNAVKLKVEEYWPQIQATISTVLDAVKLVVETVLGAIQVFWDTFGQNILTAVEIVWKAIETAISSALDIIRGIIDTVVGLIRGDWSLAWNGIKVLLRGVWDLIEGIVQTAIDSVKLILSTALNALVKSWTIIWNGIKLILSGVWDGIKTLVSGAIDEVIGFITGIGRKVSDAVTGAFDAIKDEVQPAIDLILAIVSAVDDAISALKKLNPANWNDKIVVPGGGVAGAATANFGRPAASVSPAAASVSQPVTVNASFMGNSMPTVVIDQLVSEIDRRQRLAS